MKEMTTAEFRAADLEALEEPVRLRKYKKRLGTYFPSSFEPSVADLDAPAPSRAQSERILELEDEVKRLKKLLAARETPARPDPPPARLPEGSEELLSRSRRTVKVPRHVEDPIKGLPNQDRQFFERKLGKKA
jgi:hypothetical protein